VRIYPAALIKLLLPAVLISAAFWARTHIGTLGSEGQVILNNLPYLICALAAVMAYQFNRSRLLLAACGVALFYWLVQSHLQVSLSQPDASRIYLAASLALPLLGFFLLLLPERGIWNLYGLVYFLVFVLLGLACFVLGGLMQQGSGPIAGYYAARPSEGYILSYGATVLVGLVALAGVLLLLMRNDEAEPSLLGVIAALYLALALLHLDYISVVMCVAAALCLVWGLLRGSHSMAYRDDLTGLLSRRALNERLQSLSRNYTIAMLDVDHFKRFNDTHGHDVGDEVLRLVASRIRQVGGGGTAYRYGGEEFCIIFPRKAVEDCVEVLDQVRERIANYKMSIRDRNMRPVRIRDGVNKRGATRIKESHVSVTVSAGVAARGEDYPSAESVIVAADDKLYRAKKAGRNRVVY
jgi:diguanylate cyclase (GGDEF)-like protein